MRRGVPVQPFQNLSYVQQFRDLFVTLDQVGKPGLFGNCLFDRNIETVRDEFGNPVDLDIGHAEGPAYIADDSFCLHGAVGDYLRHMLGAAIFFLHIFDHLDAPFLTEINVKVRHALSFDIQEPLKDKSVRDRVDIRDPHAVCDQRACA